MRTSGERERGTEKKRKIGKAVRTRGSRERERRETDREKE